MQLAGVAAEMPKQTEHPLDYIPPQLPAWCSGGLSSIVPPHRSGLVPHLCFLFPFAVRCRGQMGQGAPGVSSSHWPPFFFSFLFFIWEPYRNRTSACQIRERGRMCACSMLLDDEILLSHSTTQSHLSDHLATFET